MLFDLRGRGKRRTIQVIYGVMALLLGGGLIFFGIGGGGGGGGLLNAVGTSGGSSSNPFAAQVSAAEKRVAVAPTDQAAWAALVQARYAAAASGDGFDSNTDTFTAKGKAELAQAADAWAKYLALNPKTPNLDAASEMVRVFEPAQLNRPADAVSAQELVVAQNPTSPSDYSTLSVLAYLAGESRKGDLAASTAVSLEPKSEQTALKTQLATAKTEAQAEAAAEAKQASGVGTTATLPDS
jgi:hypothetical protein